jgi:ABC-type phosphate/phosphonate transport system substrate-binding protein
MKIRIKQRIPSAIISGIVIVTVWAMMGAASGGEQGISVGFTAAMISEMNPNDASASIKVLAEMITRKRSIEGAPKAEIYDDLASLRKALKDGSADIVALRVDEYLDLEPDKLLEPGFVGLRNGNWAEEYLILVHIQSGIRDIQGLREKGLSILAGRRTGLAKVWLESLLRENNLPESARFFGEVNELSKTTKVVLPVFFRQKDACLVTRSGFNTMSILNPQVGKQLVIIKESPLLLPSLICVRRNMESNRKTKIMFALSELHEDSAGQQALTLFSLDRLIPCKSEHIQTAVNILDKYRAFLKAAGVSAAPRNPKS